MTRHLPRPPRARPRGPLLAAAVVRAAAAGGTDSDTATECLRTGPRSSSPSRDRPRLLRPGAAAAAGQRCWSWLLPARDPLAGRAAALGRREAVSAGESRSSCRAGPGRVPLGPRRRRRAAGGRGRSQACLRHCG